jgi:hypothetical protein
MKTIIACGSIKPELQKLVQEQDAITLRFLPQNLHRNPDKMTGLIQKVVDKAGEESQDIVLGYGLCSNGIVGVKAPSQGLYIPRVHDCISFYLGSRERYKQVFSKYPGTYHLTKSWIDNQKDPMGLVENEYTERVGRELAEETMNTEIRNYKYISYVETMAADNEKYRDRAKKNAHFFNKKYIEFSGSENYFRKIVYGPYSEPDFVYVKPGQKVKQKEFLK